VVKLGGGEQQVGESGEAGMGEEKGEDTGSYLEGERNPSSDIGEEIYEGEEGMRKTRGRFPSDSVI